jgi:hypothetical protein
MIQQQIFDGIGHIFQAIFAKISIVLREWFTFFFAPLLCYPGDIRCAGHLLFVGSLPLGSFLLEGVGDREEVLAELHGLV